MQNLILACTLAGLATPTLLNSTALGDCGSTTKITDLHRETQQPDIVATALAAGDFGTLAKALQAADLVEALQGEGPFTVFAPTDAAFAALPTGTLDELLKPENKQTLRTILTYHVVPGRVMAKDVVKLESADALNGQRLAFEFDEGSVRIDSALVTQTDIACGNGVIHVVDEVLMPATDDIVDTALAAGKFTTLATALEAAELLETLRGPGPFTVFAPTDEAFAALGAETLATLLEPAKRSQLASILTYHVAAGRLDAGAVLERGELPTVNGQRLSITQDERGVWIDGARVVMSDIQTTNGTIHVIDAVVLPSDKDIVATALGAGSFTTLAKLLKAAGLVEALQADGPFTVFAPTDAAFAKLPAGTVEGLMAPENREQLLAILKLHVVEGRAFSNQLADGAVATLGGDVNVTLRDGGVQVNGAPVSATDIDASNGVIHVVDAVILPH